MKILITGHKGFIGSHVYDYFKNALDCQVDGIDLPDDMTSSTIIAAPFGL